jgi:GT2 family glycosyltransferase
MALEICMCSYSRPERLPIIREQLAKQTCAGFKFNVWDNTVDNQGSSARFKLAKQVKGNPIIFIDDDESLEPDFVEYMYKKYKEHPDAIQGWFTRIFNNDSYWDSIPYSPEGMEVDYVGTGGMILDRKIFDEEPILQNLPPEFDKVEDLYLSWLARKKGMKLLAVEPHIKIEVDGKDQFSKLAFYKEEAFTKLLLSGWKLLKKS